MTIHVIDRSQEENIVVVVEKEDESDWKPSRITCLRELKPRQSCVEATNIFSEQRVLHFGGSIIFLAGREHNLFHIYIIKVDKEGLSMKNCLYLYDVKKVFCKPVSLNGRKVKAAY
jgi:hypothetical protein